MAALLSTAMITEAQVATRLQFPNPRQHVYFGSSVTEYQNNFNAYITAQSPSTEDEYGKAVDVHK